MCKHRSRSFGSPTDPKVIINECDSEKLLMPYFLWSVFIKAEIVGLISLALINRAKDLKIKLDCHLFLSLEVFTFFALSLYGVLLSFAMQGFDSYCICSTVTWGIATEEKSASSCFGLTRTDTLTLYRKFSISFSAKNTLVAATTLWT